jgi:hypothetical protein
MAKISSFFKEDNGNFSSTRLIIFIMILNACVISDFIVFVGVKKYFLPGSDETLMNIVLAVSTLLTSVGTVTGGLKLMQKSMEEKPIESKPKQDETTN